MFGRKKAQMQAAKQRRRAHRRARHKWNRSRPAKRSAANLWRRHILFAKNRNRPTKKARLRSSLCENVCDRRARLPPPNTQPTPRRPSTGIAAPELAAQWSEEADVRFRNRAVESAAERCSKTPK